MKGYLQKLGGTLMLPVSVLVVASLLMGVGYAINPQAMSGEATGIAVFLVQAGMVIINNLPILFAIGISFGLADDNHGSAALSGVVSYLMITTMLKPETLSLVSGKELELIPQAFAATDNVFMGIIAGITGGETYNRFKDTKLPEWLSFFSGRRTVPIMTAVFSLIIAVVLYFVWPAAYNGLSKFGAFVSNMGALGAAIHALLNRLLIPTGLHHALNNIFWFDTIGINDIGNFWGSTGTLGVTGRYQAGFFPIMMFGLPAAALAMYRNADEENKSQVASLMLAGAIASISTGVTEPLEFSFMFAAPQLYVAHAILSGISALIAATFQWTAGFSFSAGLIDFILSSRMPLANKPYMLLVLGVIMAVVYYFVFDFMIKKFDIKTPGRGVSLQAEEDAEEVTQATGEGKYNRMARIIYQALGGYENITSIDHCLTRLRLKLKDTNAIDEAGILRAGSPGINRIDDTNLQVVIGTDVQFVADELKVLVDSKEEVKQVQAKEAVEVKEEVKDCCSNKEELEIRSPLTGNVIPLSEVPDPVFAQGMMGKGVGINPTDGKVVAPCDAEVVTAFPTGHAVGLRASNGAEILIHVGIDTVNLEGEGFNLKVKEGDQVKLGDVLIEVDLAVVGENYSTTTPVIITNSAEFENLEVVKEGEVEAGDVLLKL